MHRAGWRAVVGVALMVAATLNIAVAGRAATVAVFHPMDCPAHTFPSELNVECGFIRVPENRSVPNGRMITVAAAVIRTASANPLPDPIVFLDGGPSFGAIDSFAPSFYFDSDWYGADRDVVLVDTRGTGFSRPRLGCPELDRAAVRSFYAGPSVNSRAAQIFERATAHCRDRLTGRGIDLASYTSRESAADLEALRAALGIDQWNVLALSADGVLGLTYMRLYPDAIRSVVLDSAQSTQMLWGLDYDRGFARQLDEVFIGCRADRACRKAYPGLRRAFLRLVRHMQQHPVSITFPNFRPQPTKLVLDGVGLYADALYSIYPGNKFAPSEIPDLLDRLWRETHGQLKAVYRELFGRGPVTNDHANDFIAEGKTLSYVCHDVVNFITRADRRAAAADLPPLAPRYTARDYDLADGFTTRISPATCRVWDVGRAAAVQHQPVSSDIPTLVLAGKYDGGVTPNIVRQTTVGLSNSHFFVLPASAHLQLASFTNGSGCARRIASQFFEHPETSLDASCIANLPAVDFSP